MQTETQFHNFSQYASLSTLPPQASEEETRLEKAINDLLDKREQLVSQLSRLLDSESALTQSALKQSNLARHREILTQHKDELQRIKNQILAKRNQTNLLSNVRDDIEAYRRSNPEDAEAEYMLGERARIDRSHGVADTVLAQAYSINDQFAQQRETLASVNRRIVGAASQLPGVNALMNRISSKKRRDGIILASFIALCFLFFVWLS
jgi:Golgi SNAP receptor complex protein 1